MSTLPAKGCPLCFHPQRRFLDGALIHCLDSNKSLEETMAYLLEDFAPRKDIRIDFNLDGLDHHLKSHPLLGPVNNLAEVGVNQVRLRTGERVELSDIKSVTRLAIGAGILNILENPELMKPQHTIAFLRLLARLEGGQSGGLDELMRVLMDKMQSVPLIDPKLNPYAAESPVGRKPKTE